MFTEPFATLSIFDKAATIALYLTIAVVLLVALFTLLVKKLKPENLKTYAIAATGFVIGYGVALLAILLYLKLDEYIADGYIDYLTFIPVVALVGIVIILSAIGAVLGFTKKEKLPLFTKISFGIVGVGLLALLVAYMVKTYVDQPDINVTNEVLLYLITAVLIAALAVIALVVGKKREVNHTRSIVYASVSIAMSFALSYIRFLELPQGGSVTFASLVPLMVYSYMFGIRKGVVAGIIYGFLQFIQAPWFYHPIQFLLDYPIAFAAIGVTGLLKEKGVFENKKPLQFALGAIVAVVIRYLSHVVSGIFVFGSGDPSYGAVAWSFLYNAFTFADLAVALVAGCALFASKTFVRLIENVK